MPYILYSVALLVMVAGTVLFMTRARWQHHMDGLPIPGRDFIYARLPGSSFADDVEAGLSSSNFDLGANVEGGDSRAGLDDAAKTEILRIMKKRRLRFDEARRVYLEDRFRANGIGPDGRPKDPKFVSFS